jgi:hypothetical protein
MSTGTTNCFDPFRILSAEERDTHLKGYLEYLTQRDGEINVEERRLPHREVRFSELEAKPVEWAGDIDLEGFYQHYRETGKPPIDQKTVWLVAAAKANLGEAYGVDIELSRFFSDPVRVERADPLYLYLMLEEHCHTRLLEELCRTCRIQPEWRLPARLNRAAVHLMTKLPERVRWIPILAGEVLGSEVFKMLREGAQLFDAQPEVAERLDSLLREIWIDEVFHVAYLRAKIGPWGVRLARLLLPVVAWSVMHDVPELHRLGWTRQSVLARLRQGIEIPSDIGWMAPDPA